MVKCKCADEGRKINTQTPQIGKEVKNMAYILVKQNVEDYKKWKTVFDEDRANRKKNGSEGGWVFRSSSDPNEVVVLLKWDNTNNAKRFLESDELKKAMKQAGVVGQPNINILDQMDTPRV